MGNGEQYIWKPPEDEEMLMHQNKALGPLGAHTVENIQPSAAVVSKDSSGFVELLSRSSLFPMFPSNLLLGSINIRQNLLTLFSSIHILHLLNTTLHLNYIILKLI